MFIWTEYLSKTKDNYKDFQDCGLDIIWKQLKIVQFVVQEHKVSPKVTELQHQISKWVQNHANDQNKVSNTENLIFVGYCGESSQTIAAVNTGRKKHFSQVSSWTSAQRYR